MDLQNVNALLDLLIDADSVEAERAIRVQLASTADGRRALAIWNGMRVTGEAATAPDLAPAVMARIGAIEAGPVDLWTAGAARMDALPVSVGNLPRGVRRPAARWVPWLAVGALAATVALYLFLGPNLPTGGLAGAALHSAPGSVGGWTVGLVLLAAGLFYWSRRKR